MIQRSTLLIFIFSLFFNINISAQDCDCNINEVLNNTVASCDLILGTIVNVSSAGEFSSAINQANNSGGNMTILIADGTYQVASTSSYPYITASNLVIRSLSGNRDAVILTGGGMGDVAPSTEIGLSLVGDNITVADLTIRAVGNHAISTNSDNHFIHNVRIQDTYEQMIKGTTSDNGSSDCVVQCCLFEYTAGIGPQYYIGGIDVHTGNDWRVSDNVFYDIASPSVSLAEHAVHFWNNSQGTVVERNLIVNCDRGVGFGLGSSAHEGGVIRNNMIYNNGNDPFHDVGIGLESSPNTKVYNNTVHIEYFNAIEYRFTATNNVDIANNLCNQAISSRNGGQATVTNCIEDANASIYVDPANGDLHLNQIYAEIVDQGLDLPLDVIDDLDQYPRLVGSYDIGAHEYAMSQDLSDIELSEDCIEIFFSPVPDQFTINGMLSNFSIEIIDINGAVHSTIASSGSTATIDLSSLPMGVYLIKIISVTNNIVRVEHIIKS